MLRSFILLINIFLCISTVFAQDTISLRLLEFEKKIYYSGNDTVKNSLLVDKMDYQIRHNLSEKAVFETAKRIDYHLFTQKEQKARFLWNAGIVAYLNRDSYYALHYVDRYEAVSGDTSVQVEILKVLSYVNYDTDKGLKIVGELVKRDSLLNCFECFLAAQDYEVRYRILKKVTAFIVPGSGMLLNGNVGKGIVSMGLNTGTVLAITWLLQHNLYLNAIGWGANLIAKFYLGNVRLTDRLIESKEVKKRKQLTSACEPQILEVLAKYPLQYK